MDVDVDMEGTPSSRVSTRRSARRAGSPVQSSILSGAGASSRKTRRTSPVNQGEKTPSRVSTRSSRVSAADLLNSPLNYGTPSGVSSPPRASTEVSRTPVRGASDILNSPLNYGTPSSISTPRTSGLVTATPLRRRTDLDVDASARQVEIEMPVSDYVVVINYL